jgi:gas vesicle protein
MRKLIVIVASAALALAANGCAEKYSAERDGKKLGEALCDLKTADSADAAKDAAAEVEDQVNDLANKYAMFTAQDRERIDENISDVAEHVAQGNQALLQQDIAVIQRNAEQARQDADQTSQAAWDGIQQGLDDCLTN